MNSKEVLDEIIRTENLHTYNALANLIGVRTQVLYDIKKGRIKGITNNMADKILAAFPHYNRLWLLTGEGEKLTDGNNTQIINGNDNFALAGENVRGKVQKLNSVDFNAALSNAMKEIAEQRKLVAKSQEQIDRLLSIIEKQGK